MPRIDRPLVALLAALAIACTAASEGAGGDRGRDPPAVRGTLPDGPAPAPAAPDTLPDRLSRTLAGTFGDRAVAMDLRIEEERVSGWVRSADPGDVDRFGGPWLSGSVDPSGAVRLDEHAEEGGIRATIAGRLAMVGGRLVLEGERRPADGGAPEPVRLEETGLALGGGARLVSRDLDVSDSARGIELYVEVPRVVGPDGEVPADPAVARLDAALRERTEADRAAFVDTFDATGDSETAWMAREYGPSWYESSYDAWLAPDSILSVEFSVSTYGSGAAHPNHHSDTIVWDLAAGRRLAIEDLFRAGSGWLERLSERAVAELEASMGKMGSAEWIRDGAGPDPANFDSWSVVAEGIRIVFDPYQVAPYAAGSSTVVVPWSALAGTLDPAGPVAGSATRRVPSGPPSGP